MRALPPADAGACLQEVDQEVLEEVLGVQLDKEDDGEEEQEGMQQLVHCKAFVCQVRVDKLWHIVLRTHHSPRMPVIHLHALQMRLLMMNQPQ